MAHTGASPSQKKKRDTWNKAHPEGRKKFAQAKRARKVAKKLAYFKARKQKNETGLNS